MRGLSAHGCAESATLGCLLSGSVFLTPGILPFALQWTRKKDEPVRFSGRNAFDLAEILPAIKRSRLGA
jgi:hypothetical protein